MALLFFQKTIFTPLYGLNYDFDTGERFEPDFLLFLRKKNQDGWRQEQLFVESKGEHLVAYDQWKDDFLLRIGDESIPIKKYVDDHEYSIYGLPFFNRESRRKAFDETLRNMLL